MKKVFNYFLNYIEISNFERGGLFALLFSLLLVSGYYYHKNSSVSQKEEIDEKALAAFRLQVDSAFAVRDYTEKKYPRDDFKREKSLPLKPFDPNSDTEKQLVAKGLESYVARGIVGFRNAGATFRYKRDLAKVYAINDLMYDRLRPYIDLPTAPSYTKEVKKEKDFTAISAKEIPTGLDINTMTEEELIDLPGIGSFYAKQIIKYREKLGGYTAKEQLKEVYKMREESANEIGEMFVYAQNIKKINVNTATFKELLAHPYLDYKQVKSLMNYKEQHGPYKDFDTISNLHIFKGKDIGRLLPYLDIN